MHDDDNLLSHSAYVEMGDGGCDQKNIWKHIKQEVQLLDQTDSTIFGKEVCELLVEVMICLDEVLTSEDVHSYIVRTCPSLSIDDSMVYIYNKVRASRQSNSAQEFDRWCEKYGTRQPDEDDDEEGGEGESDDEDEGEGESDDTD
jgi:hypothetical protein